MDDRNSQNACNILGMEMAMQALDMIVDVEQVMDVHAYMDRDAHVVGNKLV